MSTCWLSIALVSSSIAAYFKLHIDAVTRQPSILKTASRGCQRKRYIAVGAQPSFSLPYPVARPLTMPSYFSFAPSDLLLFRLPSIHTPPRPLTSPTHSSSSSLPSPFPAHPGIWTTPTWTRKHSMLDRSSELVPLMPTWNDSPPLRASDAPQSSARDAQSGTQDVLTSNVRNALLASPAPPTPAPIWWRQLPLRRPTPPPLSQQ